MHGCRLAGDRSKHNSIGHAVSDIQINDVKFVKGEYHAFSSSEKVTALALVEFLAVLATNLGN